MPAVVRESVMEYLESDSSLPDSFPVWFGFVFLLSFVVFLVLFVMGSSNEMDYFNSAEVPHDFLGLGKRRDCSSLYSGF